MNINSTTDKLASTAASITPRPVQTVADKPAVTAASTSLGTDNKTLPEQVDAKQLTEALQRANEALRANNLDFRFSEDVDSGKMIVQVVDMETEKVVRQIPSADMLALSKSLEKMQGLLFKQEA